MWRESRSKTRRTAREKKLLENGRHPLPPGRGVAGKDATMPKHQMGVNMGTPFRGWGQIFQAGAQGRSNSASTSQARAGRGNLGLGKKIDNASAPKLNFGGKKKGVNPRATVDGDFIYGEKNRIQMSV